MPADRQIANEKGGPLDLRTVINATPGLIHTSQPDGYLDFFNETWLRYVGKPLDHLLGWKWTTFIHPDDVEGMVGKWRASLASGEPFLHEARVLRADGKYRWMLHHKVTLRDQQDKIVKWYGSSIDIEDRKRAEEALRSSEAYLAEAQRLSHTGSFGWKPDSGEIVWTDETYRIFEYDRAEKPTLDMVFQRIHPQDRALAQQVIEGVSGSTDFEHEYRLLMPSGAIKHIRVRAHARPDSSGNIEVIGAVTDITERKTTEDKIRRLVEAGILGIFFANVDGSIVEANHAFLQMLQYDRQDLISGRLRWADLTPAEWRERDERSLAEFLEAGVFHYEKEYFRKDGSRVPVLVGGARLQDPNEGVVYVLDLSEQKRVEEALRSSEAYLAEAQRMSQTGSWANSANGEPKYWSEECYRVLGFDPAEPLPSLETIFQRIHPDDRAAMREQLERGIRDKADFEVDMRFVHPITGIRNIRSICHAVLDRCGDLREMVGTVIDITERKTAEEKIRRLVDANILGVFIGNFEGAIIEANDAFLRMVQFGREDMVSGRLRWTDLTPPEWREREERAVAEAKASGTIQPYEREYFRRDGSRVPVMIGSALFEGGNEGVVFVVDLSEQKRAEEALRSSEAYLAEAQRLSQTGSWAWSAATGQPSYWSKECYRMLGFDPAEPLPSQEAFFQRIHPDDQASSRAVTEKGIRDKVDFEFDYRIVHPDNGVRDIHCVCHPVLDRSGELVELLGTIIDITERKAAEEKIRRLVDANILGIFSWNLDGAIVGANEAFLSLVQYGLEDLVTGRVRWTDLTPGDWHERDERALTELKETGTAQPYEKEYFRKDGSRVPVLIGGALFEGRNEGIAFVLDLSEQKRAEESLRSSEAYLAEAQKLSQTGSWAWSPDRDIRYWSEECYRVLSFDPQDGLPRFEDFFQRLHPDDQPGFRELIQTATREKSEWEADYRIVHPDGPVRDIHVVAHPILSSSGQLHEFVGTVIDVTERKRAEEELRRSEMELRQMLDLAPQQVAVFGPGGERLYANRVALDYVGLSLEEWRQAPGGPSRPGWFIHPDDRERAARGFSEGTRPGGSAFEMELRVQGADGSYRWFLLRYNPLRDDKGQIMRWYVASTDIEDRKRVEERLQRENVALREEIDQTSMFEEIVGTSPALQTVLARISKVAPSGSTVLITGETGTGKELVARAIHRRSQRSGRAFISVNCAAIPRDLIASELFGHEKGAFTGAMQRRLGRFEMADGGTIFLDEVGELSPDTQVALLRVLQEREFERVGGGHPIHVDVRVIAATNRDLQAAVSNGSFRQDLFYRFNVFPIDVPPLRERKDDILMLVKYFAQRYASRAGKNIHSIDKNTLDLLQSYDWPGNIRELQNVVERSIILSSGDVFLVDESWLSKETSQPASRVEATPRLNRDAEPRSERKIIEAALVESRGRVSGPSGAAAKLGIPPSSLDHRIKALKIPKKQFKFR
jgi:PAS domain S-box-containing protein